MNEANDWTSIEHEVASALRQQNAVGTDACPEPEALLALAQQEMGDPNPALMAHVMLCVPCRSLYTEMLETWSLTPQAQSSRRDALGTPRFDKNPSGQSEVSSSSPTDAFRQRLSAALSTWMRPAVPRYALATLALVGVVGTWGWFEQHRMAQQRLLTDSLQNRLAQSQRQRQASDAQQTELKRRFEQQIAQIRSQDLQGMQLRQEVDRMRGMNDALNHHLAQIETSMRKAKSNGAGRGDAGNAQSRTLQAALNSGQVKAPREIAELPPDMQRGSEGGTRPVLLSPLDTAVSSDRPSLRWQAVPDAAGYTVIITDLASHLIMKATTKAPATTWQVSPALPRGNSYLWQVQAMLSKDQKLPPSHPGGFRVLSTREIDEYADAHLLLGQENVRLGLLTEAERELKQAITAAPNSIVARKAEGLLRYLRELRPVSPKPIPNGASSDSGQAH